MYEHDKTEQAYKNGYEAGKKEAQAEIEKKDIEIDILIRKKDAAYDEIERLKAGIILLPESEEFINEVKTKAIKECMAELYNRFKQYENYDRHYTFEILDRIESVEEFFLNNLVKEMAEKGGEKE